MPKKKQETYEEIKEKLDNVVSRLSDEKLTLSEMMTLYEDGSRYAAQCREMLDSYRKTIEEADADDEGSEALEEDEE